MVKAVATIRGDAKIAGTVTFEQESESSPTTITWNITGNDANAKRGIHVHTYGDLNSTDGSSAGGHYNPDSHSHGLPGVNPSRHAGDFGSIQDFDNSFGYYDFAPTDYTPGSSLNLDNYIGRAVVIHSGIDHGNEPTCPDAANTGNSGVRNYICVIGIANNPNSTHADDSLPEPNLPNNFVQNSNWTNIPCDTNAPAPEPTNPPTNPPTDPPTSCSPTGTLLQVLKDHITERTQFGISSDLQWDCKLAQIAQAYTDSCPGLVHSDSAKNKVTYGTGEAVGENLAVASGQLPSAQGWINEKKNWACNSNVCQVNTTCGHYTQMIWRMSTKVGCGLTMGCTKGGWPNVLVCNYAPAGNYNGQHPLLGLDKLTLPCPASYAITEANTESQSSSNEGQIVLSVSAFAGVIVGCIIAAMILVIIIIGLISKYRRSYSEKV